IIINLWVGIPYTLLDLTGILQNIPGELYESARIDGASTVTTFFKITLPYMLFVTAPNLIVTFTNNINNFNVIYLLS
ncbi:ABC transporter permease subunit, partial [Escherichia coli]|uniref:ABC transporter permease subunit n=4 Tax=Bacteria TaxID=2 RepID=UPI0028DEC64C